MWEQERVGGGGDGLEPGSCLRVQKPKSNINGCKEQAKLGSGGEVAP